MLFTAKASNSVKNLSLLLLLLFKNIIITKDNKHIIYHIQNIAYQYFEVKATNTLMLKNGKTKMFKYVNLFRDWEKRKIPMYSKQKQRSCKYNLTVLKLG